MDEVAMTQEGTDDEVSLLAVHDLRLSEFLRSDAVDTPLGHAVRRLVRDLDEPQEAIAAFGSYVE